MAESRSVKTIALSLGQGMSMIISMVVTMVAVRLLSVEQYATFRQTFLVYQLAEPFLLLSLPMALYFFMGRDGDRKQQTVFESYLMLLGSGTLFGLFFLFGGNALIAQQFQNPHLQTTLLWVAPFALFMLPAAILSTVMVVQNRTIQLSLYNIVSRLLLAFLSIGGCYWFRNAESMIWAQLIWSVITLPLASYLIFSSLKGSLRLPELQHMYSIVKYAIPLGLSTILSSVMIWMDKFIVASLCPPEEFAVYANGALELPLIGVVTGSIATVIMADMARHCHEGQHRVALELFRKSSVFSALLLFPCLCFFLFFGEAYIQLIFSEKYAASVVPFTIYLFVLPFRIVYYGGAMIALGLSRMVFYRSMGDLLVNMVMAWGFVHLFGSKGAAIATLLTMYCWSLPFNLAVLRRGFHCQIRDLMPFRQLSKIMLIAGVSALLASSLLLIGWGPLMNLLFGGIFFSVCYIWLVFLLIPEGRGIASLFSRHPPVRPG